MVQGLPWSTLIYAEYANYQITQNTRITQNTQITQKYKLRKIHKLRKIYKLRKISEIQAINWRYIIIIETAVFTNRLPYMLYSNNQ